MTKPPGGRGPAGAGQVTGFTAGAAAAPHARFWAWALIAAGAGCLLLGGIFLAANPTGHNDVVAIVTQEGPCSHGTCTVRVSYYAGDREVSAVMHGVPRGEVYGAPWPRLTITYPASDLPGATWIASWAVGLACAGSGAWLRRRTRHQPKLTEAAVVTGMTPQHKAPYALDSGLPRADLPEAVRAAYDRIRDERQRAHVRAARPGVIPPVGPFRPSRRLERWAAEQADETRAHRRTVIALRFLGLVACPHPTGQRVLRVGQTMDKGDRYWEVCLLCQRVVWTQGDRLMPPS